jgi:predicted AAA+ superfamily ATPase
MRTLRIDGNVLLQAGQILDRGGGPRFYLTGSSARKLRRGQANLLPGRVHVYSLGPLVCGELERDMDTRAALSTGTLPGIYLDPERPSREKTLSSYCATYLKEEIQAEALTRNFRTEHGAEVDFIVETKKHIWAVEVKASKSIGKHDLPGLKRFREFHGKKCGAVVLYLGTVEKKIEGIEILPWQAGPERIGS